jgi:tetratricopeptide (TPR) repeat protein
MRPRPSVLALLCALALALAGGLASWIWTHRLPAPALEAAIALANANEFDRAERQASLYVRRYPHDSRARYMIVQLLLDRPEPGESEARRALEHIDWIRPDTAQQEALVEAYRGKAANLLGRLDGAEAAWKKGLELDHAVPEAGWGLLDLYYVEGRTNDAVQLALRLRAIEPDPRDRVLLLLELVRQDTHPLAPRYLVQWFGPRSRQNPDDLHAALGLGHGLILNSQIEEGLALLNRVVDQHPDRADAWDALLTGLEDGGAESDDWSAAFARLPANLAGEPRFARHRGRLAQDRFDWPTAAEAYERACEYEPGNPKLLYRLARALHYAGKRSEAEQAEKAYRDYQLARDEIGAVYKQADADKSLGAVPDPDLYRRFALLRERMGRRDEAIAWQRLVLHAQPNDPESRAALERCAKR